MIIKFYLHGGADVILTHTQIESNRNYFIGLDIDSVKIYCKFLPFKFACIARTVFSSFRTWSPLPNKQKYISRSWQLFFKLC